MQNKDYLRAFVTGTALLWFGTSAIAQISLPWEATLARRGVDRVLRSIEPPALTHSLLTIGVRARSVVEAALQDPALSNQREAIHALQLEATRALGFYQQLELRRNYDEREIEALYFLVLDPTCDQPCRSVLFQQYEDARRELAGVTESAFLEALETVTPSGLEIWNRRDLSAWREWATHQPVAVAYWLGRHVLELTDINRNDPEVWFRVPYVLALFETVKEREPNYDHWGGLAYFGLSRWILTPPQPTGTSRTLENAAIDEAIRQVTAGPGASRGDALHYAFRRLLLRDLRGADLRQPATRERLKQALEGVLNLYGGEGNHESRLRITAYYERYLVRLISRLMEGVLPHR